MKQLDTDSLAEMAITMLERTAMVIAEPAAPDVALPEPTRFAQIAYSGPSRGRLTLCADEGFLRELAAGMLGVETSEVDADRQGSDALKEMANVVAGSIIFALAGDACEYSLGLPETIAAATVPTDGLAVCDLVAEGGVLRLILSSPPVASGVAA